MSERRIYINNDLDIVMARMQAREVAKEMGFGTADQARISLAASELARILTWDSHGPGEIVMSMTNNNGQQGVQVVCMISLDNVQTPNGASYVDPASVPGRSLAGACQLVDESVVEEQDKQQARIKLIKWLK